MTWLHTAPEGSSTTCKKNNLTWYWCTKCVRWSPHKLSACPRTSTRKPATAYANICVDVNSDDSSVASADEWSDDDIKVSKPRKKARRSKSSGSKKTVRKRTKTACIDISGTETE